MDNGDIYQTNNYGELEIVQYIDSRNVRVRFLATGFETVATAGSIRKGTSIRDKYMPSVCGVGYSGEGKYSGSKDAKAYRCWEGMLFRCYDANTLERHPTYIGNTVTESWHDFQIFCVWFYENYKEGLYLVKSCKSYSEDTCSFGASSIKLTGKTFEFKYTTGLTETTTNRADFCRKNSLDPSAVTRLVKGTQRTHKGWVYLGEVK